MLKLMLKISAVCFKILVITRSLVIKYRHFVLINTTENPLFVTNFVNKEPRISLKQFLTYKIESIRLNVLKVNERSKVTKLKAYDIDASKQRTLDQLQISDAVSYTHLTLPTIYSV